MRTHALACVLAVLTAAAGYPQKDEWRLRMDEGTVASVAGDYNKATAFYREAARVAESFDRGDRRRVFAWNSVATMYDALGRFADAEAAYYRALRAAEQEGGKSCGDYGLVLGNLASLFAEIGQNARGEKMMREALAIHLAADQRDVRRIALAQNCLAEICSVSHKYQEAERLLTASLALLEETNPKDFTETSLALNNLGVVRFSQGNFVESRRLLRQALTMMEEHMGTDHPMVVRVLNNLAGLAIRMGDRDEAGEDYGRAIDIAQKRLGPEHPFYGVLLANYAGYLKHGGEKSRAKALQAQSDQILRNSALRNGVGAVVDINALKGK